MQPAQEHIKRFGRPVDFLNIHDVINERGVTVSTKSMVSAAMQEFLVSPGVSEARMFGSSGLKVQGKYFALLVREKLVVKLTKETVENLVESGRGKYFDPGHGRKMKEWVELQPRSKNNCMKYMADAYEIVSAGAPGSGKKGGARRAKA